MDRKASTRVRPEFPVWEVYVPDVGWFRRAGPGPAPFWWEGVCYSVGTKELGWSAVSYPWVQVADKYGKPLAENFVQGRAKESKK